MERYYHKYKGIVIQNDDPEMMGRVKVWVPHVNMTLYKGWNDDREQDKMITELGGNLGGSLTPELLLRLKNSLPWGLVEQPIFGMGTATTYHADKNFAEIANDADNSPQHAVINKLPPTAPPPAVSPFKALGNAMAATGAAPAPPNAAQTINNYSNPNTSSTALDYIKNSVAPPKDTTTASSGPNVPPTLDNIAQIIITFNPNSRNASNTHRRFNTTATISDSTGSLTGNAQAVGQFNSFTNTFTTPGTPVSATSISYAPPITYAPYVPVPSPLPPLPVPNTGVFTRPLTVSGNATTQPNNRVSDENGSFIQVTFVPNSRNANNTHRRFTTSASLIVFNQTTGNITVSSDRPTSLNVNDISNIEVVYDKENTPIDLNSARLGQLAGLTGQYTNNASVGIPASPITPPSSISAPKPNRGGGGGELFSLIYSNLLPFSTLLNSLVGNANPCSQMNYNYKRPPTNGTDPQKTKGANLQSSAFCGPPFRSPTQSNKAKGMVSIPAVGAHVSVYFEDGDPQYPIVDGVFYPQESMAAMHDVNGPIPS
jgi:hypothetical protein